MIKASLYHFFGQIYIPDTFDLEGSYLLHISDTPSAIFGALDGFIKRIKPKVIIHTGDLVDNLKLEIYPSSLDGYKRYVKRLIRMLEKTDSALYYVIGNHDDFDAMYKCVKKGRIINGYEEIFVNDFCFGLTHKPEQIEVNQADYVLYGHNIDLPSNYNTTPKYLNGIEKICLIHLETGEIFTFDYPMGTKEQRLVIYRKGL